MAARSRANHYQSRRPGVLNNCTTQRRLIWHRSLPASLICRLDEDSDQPRLISSSNRPSSCWSFLIAGANIWNSLPAACSPDAIIQDYMPTEYITAASSLAVFKQRLKTFLFRPPMTLFNLSLYTVPFVDCLSYVVLAIGLCHFKIIMMTMAWRKHMFSNMSIVKYSIFCSMLCSYTTGTLKLSKCCPNWNKCMLLIKISLNYKINYFLSLLSYHRSWNQQKKTTWIKVESKKVK